MIEGSSETKSFAYLLVVTNHNGIENSWRTPLKSIF